MIIIILIIIIAGLFVLRFSKRPKQSSTIKDFTEIPGPIGLPLIGNTWRYLPIIGQYKPDSILENGLYNFKHYGPIVREQITSTLAVLHLFDPKDIETFFRQETLFLRSESRYPHRRSHRALLKYRLDRPDKYNDGGLFPENGPKWYEQRKKFERTLSNVSRYVDLAEDIAIKFVPYLVANRDISTNEVHNLQKYLYRWSMENSLKFIFNSHNDHFEEKRTSEFNKLIQANHDALESIAKTETSLNELWKNAPNKCPHYQKLIRSQELLYDFVSEHINKAKSSCDKPIPDSLLSQFFTLNDADDKDITTMTLDLILAGLHTTSYTVAFVLYHLALNQRVQTELRREIFDHLPPNRQKFDKDSFAEMKFLQNCVKESMRLQPLSVGTGRYIDYDGVVIRNYSIRKNTMVITHNQVACMNEGTFKEAFNYKPQRWSDSQQIKPNKFALLPFGHGARVCIGKRLAEIQIYSLVAHILRNFRVECEDRIKTKNILINVPDRPITMKFFDL